jgi:hypothetical protein
MKRINIFLYLLVAATFTSCEEADPLDIEQYKKEAYLVGANQSNNEALSIVKLPYLQTASEEAPTFVTVAVGGSKETDRDIQVSVAEAGMAAIDRYNFLYLFNPTDIRYEYLNSSRYRIPETTATIKAGQTYANIPIYIKTAPLDPDGKYALTFKVSSITHPDYVSIRKRDTVLMFSFSLNNPYSGDYQMVGEYVNQTNGVVTPVSTSRTLKALNHNTIRLIHTANDERASTAAADLGVSVKVNADNTLEVKPWKNFMLLSGGGTYNPSTKTFNIWYTYKEGTLTYRFEGKYINNQS